MAEPSTGDTQPIPVDGLYFFGYITILDEGLQSTVHITEVKIPICPTCEPEPMSKEPEVTIVTPTLSPTPDYGATATEACGSFNEQFPGTPCPTLSNP